VVIVDDCVEGTAERTLGRRRHAADNRHFGGHFGGGSGSQWAFHRHVSAQKHASTQVSEAADFAHLIAI
jgi:hypothetical protein